MVNGGRVTKEYTPGCVTETVYIENSQPKQHIRTATNTDLKQIGETKQAKLNDKQQNIVSQHAAMNAHTLQTIHEVNEEDEDNIIRINLDVSSSQRHTLEDNSQAVMTTQNANNNLRNSASDELFTQQI